MNSLHHQVRNPGKKVTTTSPPHLANPLVMSWYLGETVCHCMHVVLSRLLFSQLAVDVPKHLDLPEAQGWFVVDCLHVSYMGTWHRALFSGSWLSESPWELDNILPFWIIVKTITAWSQSSYCLLGWESWKRSLELFFVVVFLNLLLMPSCLIHSSSWFYIFCLALEKWPYSLCKTCCFCLISATLFSHSYTECMTVLTWAVCGSCSITSVTAVDTDGLSWL